MLHTTTLKRNLVPEIRRSQKKDRFGQLSLDYIGGLPPLKETFVGSENSQLWVQKNLPLLHERTYHSYSNNFPKHQLRNTNYPGTKLVLVFYWVDVAPSWTWFTCPILREVDLADFVAFFSEQSLEQCPSPCTYNTVCD